MRTATKKKKTSINPMGNGCSMGVNQGEKTKDRAKQESLKKI